mgnify:CR=1 FL=1
MNLPNNSSSTFDRDQILDALRKKRAGSYFAEGLGTGVTDALAFTDDRRKRIGQQMVDKGQELTGEYKRRRDASPEFTDVNIRGNTGQLPSGDSRLQNLVGYNLPGMSLEMGGTLLQFTEDQITELADVIGVKKDQALERYNRRGGGNVLVDDFMGWMEKNAPNNVEEAKAMLWKFGESATVGDVTGVGGPLLGAIGKGVTRNLVTSGDELIQMQNQPRVEGQRISPKISTAKRPERYPLIDPLDPSNTLGVEDIYATPDLKDKRYDLVQKHGTKMNLYPSYFDSPDAAPQEVIENMKNFSVDNLIYLHDQMPVDLRNQARKWYDGANQIAVNFAEMYDTTPEGASGVIAAMSPQREWFSNVALAEKVLSAMKYERATKWSPEMNKVVKDIKSFQSDGHGKITNRTVGKTLGEILNDKDNPERGLQAATWIRAFEEAHGDKRFRVVTPEGKVGDFSRRKETGEPGMAGWGSFSEIAKSVNVILDPSMENISRQMGAKHKVRNFYNNIVSPSAGYDVTIDTHAVAAGLLRPLSQESVEVAHNFGGSPKPGSFDYYRLDDPTKKWGGIGSSGVSGLQGSYATYASAYREAAEKIAQRDNISLLPRELQSITWEAIRAIYPAEFKKSDDALRLIGQAERSFREGDLSKRQFQDQATGVAGGFQRDRIEWAK